MTIDDIAQIVSICLSSFGAGYVGALGLTFFKKTMEKLS